MSRPTSTLADEGTRREVAYRALHDEQDLDGAVRVLRAVWGEDAESLPSAVMLRALSHAGNPVLGAVADGQVLGVSIGFLAPGGGLHLHSHITGVLPAVQHLGIGVGLKWAQRAWCVEHGIDLVVWTFDPLLARNAHVNLHKLGATSCRLLASFYGTMTDAVNAGDASDRLEVRWAVRSNRVEAAMSGRHGGPGGRPVRGTVPVPTDYAALRQEDPAAAAAARAAVRAELVAAFDAGLEIVDFARGEGGGAGYVLADR